MSVNNSSITAALPTTPQTYMPWRARPSVLGATPTHVMLTIVAMTSFVAASGICAMLILSPGWILATLFGATILLVAICITILIVDPVRAIYEKAHSAAKVACRLNDCIDIFFGKDGHKNEFDDAPQKAFKDLIAKATDGSSGSLNQFGEIIDILLKNGNDVCVDGVLAVLRDIMPTLALGTQARGFVMGCLERNLYYVAGRRALLAVLSRAVLVANYNFCSKNEAEKLCEMALNMLVDAVKDPRKTAEDRHVITLLIDSPLTDEQRALLRATFQIQSLDGVDTAKKQTEFVSLCERTGEASTFDQVATRYHGPTRAAALHKIKNAEDFGEAFRMAQDPKSAILKEDFEIDELHRCIYPQKAIRKKNAELHAEPTWADILGYFTSPDTMDEGRALAENTCRYGNGKTWEQLCGTLEKIPHEQRAKLQAVFTLEFIKKCPPFRREWFLRAAGYPEERIHEIEKIWSLDGTRAAAETIATLWAIREFMS
jgi:hypothetical protein